MKKLNNIVIIMCIFALTAAMALPMSVLGAPLLEVNREAASAAAPTVVPTPIPTVVPTPIPTVVPTPTPTATPTKNYTKEDYIRMLSYVRDEQKSNKGLDDAEKRKVDEIYELAIKEINAEANLDIVNAIYSRAESAITSVSKKEPVPTIEPTPTPKPDIVPASTSDYIQTGNTWVTPVATHGQDVIVALPLVNMGRHDVTEVVVTPKISPLTKEWPFEIILTNYALKLDYLQGEYANADVAARTQTLFWTFKTKEDVLNGYYKIEYDVLYTNADCEQEKATITTYVQAVGKPGAGSVDGDSEEEKDGKISTPRVIVTGFETSPETIYAGETFTLTLHVKNTSKKTAVSNVEFNLEAAVEGKDNDSTYSAFLPTSGSSTIYVNSIKPEGTTDLSIDLTAKADLVQKPYVLNVKMLYEDAKFNPYEGTASVSIPVKQESKFDTSIPEAMPASISVGGESNVMMSIYNTGKTKLYNVQVKFVGSSVAGGDTFVGNLDSGATGNVDAMLTGAALTADDGTIKAIVSYEDETGKVFTAEKTFNLLVTEMMEEFPMDPGMNGNMEGMSEKPALPLWGKIAIGGGSAAVIGGIVAAVLLIKRKKAKLLQMDLDDDE